MFSACLASDMKPILMGVMKTCENYRFDFKSVEPLGVQLSVEEKCLFKHFGPLP